MNKYEVNTQKKKNTIIQATIELFSKYGYSHVSIKDIANKAQVSQVSIYNYFGSKEALVSACVNTLLLDTIKQSNQILHSKFPFKKKVEKALQLCTNNISIAISSCFLEASLKDPTLARLLNTSIQQQKQEIFVSYIELGKKEKEINCNIPTDIYIKYIHAIDCIDLSTTEMTEDTLSQIHRLFLYGLYGK